MTRVRLADVADQIRGVAYDKADVGDGPADGYLPVLRANNIGDDGLNFADLVYVKSKRISQRQLVRKGDIVIAASSGSLSVVGKAAQANGDFIGGFGAFCKIVRPREGVDARYLGHYFRSSAYRRRISSLAAGANINNIRNEHIDDLDLPLPPLPEQKRIAAILDQADELRRKRSFAIRRLKAVGDAFFSRLFRDAASREIATIGSFALVKGGKRLPKGVEYASAPTAHPYIRVSDLRDGAIAIEGLKYISPDVQKKVARYTVDEDDLIISIAGTIGTVAPVPKQLSGANLTENAAKITSKPGAEFDATYLSWALRSPQAQHQIASRTGQVTIGKLALFRIEEITVPFPPFEKQRTFAEGLQQLEREMGIAGQHLRQLDALFASVHSRAFRGEL